MKTLFLYFFQKFKTLLFDKSKRIFANPNDVIKFINTKIEKPFLFFLTEKHNTRVSALLSTYKRDMRTEGSFHVS